MQDKKYTWDEQKQIVSDFFKLYDRLLKKKKKKDNSKNGDMFLNCRSCKTIITNDYRSKFDTRYCADCL